MSKFVWSAAALSLLAASSLAAQGAQKPDAKKAPAVAPAAPAKAATTPAAPAQAKPKTADTTTHAAKAAASKPAARHMDGTTATADQMKKAQQALIDKGIYKGKVTGRSNAAFKAALKQYQKDSGLSATGRLNQETLAKLGIQ
jgi:peptidoglycan hydrolase-like protein with peptidoglycan-binding domain